MDLVITVYEVLGRHHMMVANRVPQSDSRFIFWRSCQLGTLPWGVDPSDVNDVAALVGEALLDLAYGRK